MLTSLSIATFFSASALSQELTDVALGEDEQGSWIWLALDTQPQTVAVQEGPHFIIQGISLSNRQIDLSQTSVFSQMVLTSLETGDTDIRFDGSAMNLIPEVRQGGILVRWHDTDGRTQLYELDVAVSDPIRTDATGSDPVGTDPTGPDATQPNPARPETRPLVTSVSAIVQTEPSSVMSDDAFPVLSAEAVFAQAEAEIVAGSVETPVEVDLSDITETTVTGSSEASEPSENSPASLTDEAQRPDTMVNADITEDSVPDREDSVFEEVQTRSVTACQDTSVALEESPWDLDTMSGHAACLQEAGASGDAATLYQQVLAFEPSHYQAALGLAEIKLSEGDLAEARRLFLEAARAARTDGEALSARARADALDADG